jgi:multicomponent Na+:H+ antiporter subunit A
MILAGLGALFALAPSSLATLCAAAASAATRTPVAPSDALLHGITPALVLSLLTLPVGAALYAAREPLRRAGAAGARALRLRPAAGYERSMAALAALARWQTRVLQNGYLGWYLIVTVGTAAVLLAFGLADAPLGGWERAFTDLRLVDAGLVAAMLAAALTSALTESRFTAIAAMGTVGLSVAAIYLTLGAPDLAMTQFVVEILNMAVFVLAFSQLPRFRRLSSGVRRARDVAIAGALGAAMFVLVLVAGGTEPGERASDWFAANTLAAAHGHNVVNVILTDFRSIDTLGEIAVLTCAAVGAVGLLSMRRATP